MNIVYLISDTFRYDNLFAPGGEHSSLVAEMPVRTPNLDAFVAERAVSVSNMFMSSFPTIPHRTDLTSGRFGWPWYGWQKLSASTPNRTPKLLADQGLATQLVCDCPHLYKTEFHLDFMAHYGERGQEGDVYSLHLNDAIARVDQPLDTIRSSRHTFDANLADLSQWIADDRKYEDEWFPYRTSGRIVRWLERNYAHKGFFLWADFFDPHEPWDPPEYLAKRYDPDYEGPAMFFPTYGPVEGVITEAQLRNMRAHYCALSEMIDRAMGRIFQKIDDLGLWDDTVVVFTADHGTSIGEHDRTGKSNIYEKDERGWPLYPEIAQVPFLIAAPGLEGGRTIDTLAQTPDILPTVLDLAGIGGAEMPEAVHGRSFAAQLRGESTASIREIAITARHDAKMAWSASTLPVVYTKEWAWAPFGMADEAELYDMTNDPYCERNVIDKHPEVVRDMRAELGAWLDEIDAPAYIKKALT